MCESEWSPWELAVENELFESEFLNHAYLIYCPYSTELISQSVLWLGHASGVRDGGECQSSSFSICLNASKSSCQSAITEPTDWLPESLSTAGSSPTSMPSPSTGWTESCPTTESSAVCSWVVSCDWSTGSEEVEQLWSSSSVEQSSSSAPSVPWKRGQLSEPQEIYLISITHHRQNLADHIRCGAWWYHHQNFMLSARRNMQILH